MLRFAVVGVSLALLCTVFTCIYEQFSHGAVSTHMRCMLLMPLVGCGLVGLVGLLTPMHRFVNRVAFNLWNSGVAAWTVGCLFRGIVNISGRYTDLDRLYWILGWILLGLAIITQLISLLLSHPHSKEASRHD